MTPREPLLALKNVHVHYGGVKALDGADVFLGEGEVVALMGPNGAGKSTVLKAIFGLAPMESGKVLWHGSEVSPVPHEMAERGVAFVPQGRRVFKYLSVRENLELGCGALKNRDEKDRRIKEALDIFPILREKLNTKSGLLSGGQQQMLAIARALMSDPKVLLLDEPSLGLSPKVVKEVFAKIKEINERHHTAILAVEHNIASLLAIADRAYVLDKGKVAAEDSALNILQSDILEKVFFGKVGIGEG